MIVVFVDDLLTSGHPDTIEKITEALKEIFVIGAEHINIFRYIGMNITQNQDYTINLDQKAYINSVESIPTDGLLNENKEDPATPLQTTSLRSLVGKLNWILSISRPDIGYDTRYLSTILNNAKIKDIFRANKTLKKVKSEDVEVKFPSFSSLNNLSLVVFADASYGNLPNGNSQAAYIILLVDDNYSSCPIGWNSFKLKRVAKSTLSAETLALSEAIDHAQLLSLIYGEVINPKDKKIPIIALSDSKSLVSAAHTTNLIQEKRLRIEIAALRESIENNEVTLKWIDSKHQISNCLTKQGACNQTLIQVITSAKCSDEIISALEQ